MQPSDSRDLLLNAVENELRALEALSASVERALMLRRWDDLDRAIADARRITHALQNAMDEAQSVRDEAFDAGVFRRLRYVEAIRNDQITRLQQYHDAVGERLQLLARWKAALRSVGKAEPASRLGALDRLS